MQTHVCPKCGAYDRNAGFGRKTRFPGARHKRGVHYQGWRKTKDGEALRFLFWCQECDFEFEKPTMERAAGDLEKALTRASRAEFIEPDPRKWGRSDA